MQTYLDRARSFFAAFVPFRTFRGPNARRGPHPSLFVVVAAALLLSGCEVLPQQASPLPTLMFVPPPTATLSPNAVYTVKRGPIQVVISARGRVASAQETTLSFSMSGYLRTINVQPGDLVRKGDLVAELDSPTSRPEPLQDAIVDANFDLQLKSLELDQAKSEPIDQEILRAKSALKQTQVGLQQAQANYDKVAWQGDASAAGPEAFALQRAQLSMESAQADYNAAVARKDPQGLRLKYLDTQIAYDKAKLDRAQRRLAQAEADTRLTAPFTGTVVSVDKTIGDAVAPYESIGVIADPSQVRLEANILETDMARVRVGLPVSITLDAYPDQSLSGKIQAIATQPTAWQGKSAYATTIEFDDPARVPATIRMGADVNIVTRVVADALLIPTAAIKNDGSQRYVDLMNDVGASSRVDVGAGITSGPLTEILWGLAEGDTIKRN